MSRSALFLALALLLPRAAWAQAASAPVPGDTLRAIELAQAEVLPELKNRSDVARSLWELYPQALKDARVRGTATVRFVVGEQGAIVAPRVVGSSGHAELDGAALRVVEGMRFEPARRGGAPVAAWVTLPLTFTLPADAAPAASGSGAATPAAAGGAGADVLAGVPAERVKAWADSAGALAPSQVHEIPSVANGVEAARALGEYPRELRESGAEGKPVVWFVVTREGRQAAARVAVSGGSPAVDSAALRAVERIRFHPARVGGVPVDSWVALPFEFTRPSTPRARAAGDTVQAFELNEVEELPALRNRSEVSREIVRQYPVALRDGGVSGEVVIRMRLGLDGTPELIEVDRSSHPEFALAALRVVEKMRFSPARVNGKPARVWVSLPVMFEIQARVGPEPMQPTPLGRPRRDPWGQPWP